MKVRIRTTLAERVVRYTYCEILRIGAELVVAVKASMGGAIMVNRQHYLG